LASISKKIFDFLKVSRTNPLKRTNIAHYDPAQKIIYSVRVPVQNISDSLLSVRRQNRKTYCVCNRQRIQKVSKIAQLLIRRRGRLFLDLRNFSISFMVKE